MVETIQSSPRSEAERIVAVQGVGPAAEATILDLMSEYTPLMKAATCGFIAAIRRFAPDRGVRLV